MLKIGPAAIGKRVVNHRHNARDYSFRRQVLSSPMFYLHDEDIQGQDNGDGVGAYDGPGHDDDSVDKPEENAQAGEAEHHDGEVAGMPRSMDFPGLRDKGRGGAEGRGKTERINPVHLVLPGIFMSNLTTLNEACPKHTRPPSLSMISLRTKQIRPVL